MCQLKYFNVMFLLLMTLLMTQNLSADSHTLIKGFYQFIHPVEILLFGHDAMYELKKNKQIPQSVPENRFEFYPYQETIWSAQLGLKTLSLLEQQSPLNELQLAQKEQLTQTIVELQSELKKILQEGKIEALRVLGKGVHPSFVAVLSVDGKRAIEAVVKPDREFDGGADSNAEAAAYEFDQLLDFQFVPMVVQRTFYHDKKASLQYFIRNATVAKELPLSQQIIPPSVKRFDYLVRQWDRCYNPGNYLYLDLTDPVTQERVKKTVAIDHGTAFQRNGHMWKCHKIFSLDKGKIKKLLDNNYSQYKGLKALSEDQLQKAVPHLEPIQVRLLLKRRDLFVYKVNKTMKRKQIEREVDFFKTLPSSPR